MQKQFYLNEQYFLKIADWILKLNYILTIYYYLLLIS